VPDPTDFSRTYARFVPPIRAKCRRLLGASSHAEDIVQETFLRLWNAGPAAPASDPRAVMAWLYRTCTRLAIDVLRERRKAGPRTDEPHAERAAPCGCDLAASAEARATIARLARDVPEDELEVAVLCRVDGLAQPEAALVLGVSERTVRRMLDRFDARTGPLRKELAS
jgi:RNA polymerase sigma-70 factor (ECF subfamily)